MLRRYSKARSAASGQENGDVSNYINHTSLDGYERQIQKLSTVVEVSKKSVDQLLQELREKHKQEANLKDELEGIKESLKNEKENISKIIFERDRLISLCSEKESALQAALLDKRNIETKFAKSSNETLLSTTNKYGAGIDGQTFHKLREELKMRDEALRTVEETARRLANEKSALEQRTLRLENQFRDEVKALENKIAQERRTKKIQMSKVEKKLESVKQDLAVAKSTLQEKNSECAALQQNLLELKELQEMKQDIDRKNEQTAAILKMQGNQLDEFETLYKEE